MLVRANRIINVDRLKRHYEEMVNYDVSEQRISPHIDHLIELLREENLV